MIRIIVSLLVVCHAELALPEEIAREIVQRADDKFRGKTSRSEMTMTISRPNWSRTVAMKSWSKGRDYALVLITAPAKEKGQAFLKRQNEMWQWVPAIDRMIKIPPSMMSQSWMGSDFTNDDLLKESSILLDYSHEKTGLETIRGYSCHKIELTPLPDAAVVWGKILLWIEEQDYLQIRAEFFDEESELVHTENFYDIRPMGDRTIPTRMEIIPAGKPGHSTTLLIDAIEYNTSIDDAFFSQQNMKRVR
ncbi:MAG TPA: outer membrane lipoprotein-sorting protein [bacterium]|nr:outer membrane lipoprotein-sorting protein [bacterium]